jgi:hypothetical protein
LNIRVDAVFSNTWWDRESRRILTTDKDFEHSSKFYLVQKVRIELYLEPAKDTPNDCFALDWHLEQFVKTLRIPRTKWTDKLFSKFGNLAGVVNYLIHRRRQFKEAGLL